MGTLKKMLIFGCSSGIGLEIIKLSQTYDLKVVGISKNSLKEKLTNLLSFHQIDLSNIENLQKIRNALQKEHQNFDVCIYNAGYAVAGNIFNMKAEDIVSMVNINFLMPFLIFKLLINNKIMKRNSKIVYISTTATEKQIPEIIIYTKTKKILEEIIKSYNEYLDKLKIRFISIKLGRVNTNFGVNFAPTVRKEMKRGLSPQEVANYVLSIAVGEVKSEFNEICIKK